VGLMQQPMRKRGWRTYTACALVVVALLGGVGYFTLPYISSIGAIAPTVAIGAPVDAKFAGSDGSSRALSEFSGKVVVLEWTNPACEFTARHYASGAMQKLQREAIAGGAIWVPVSSTAKGQSGYVDAAAAKALMAERKMGGAFLALDDGGLLGRLFGANATPSAVIIGKDGRLAYAGAIDDAPWGDGTTGSNHVRDALADLAAGRPVRTPFARAYGCGIKYGP
jgi:hypothetical protein